MCFWGTCQAVQGLCGVNSDWISVPQPTLRRVDKVCSSIVGYGFGVHRVHGAYGESGVSGVSRESWRLPHSTYTTPIHEMY